MMRPLVVECESRARVTDVRDARRACNPFELAVPSVRMRARRVGRGPHRSYCILLSDAGDPLARRRLETIAGSSDGFAIAEADLSLRGAGNLLGTRQAGLPPLRVASLFEPRHLALAEQARELATVLVREDSTLADRPDLRRELDALTVADEQGDGG